MAKTTKARPIQTEVKHVILREYIGAWGGIILGGISRYPVKWGSGDNFAFYTF